MARVEDGHDEADLEAARRLGIVDIHLGELYLVRARRHVTQFLLLGVLPVVQGVELVINRAVLGFVSPFSFGFVDLFFLFAGLLGLGRRGVVLACHLDCPRYLVG